MAMNKLNDESKKNAIAPDPISAAAGGIPAANAMKAATVAQASARPAWAASPTNPAPAPQGQQGYQMFAPTTASTNQQLQTAREGIGSGRAASNRRLLEKAMQVSPEIRQSAKDRMEWRTMTPEQRRTRIGEKKLEQEAIAVNDRIGKTTSWEQMADATGTNLDSYGSSEQFYTPDQILYKRQAEREFDKEWADVLSNVDRSAFPGPQEIYQLQEQLPSVQKYGDFLGSYRYNVTRKFASPEIRAQMEADDRNQKNVKSAFLSMAREQIAEMKERLGGEYSTMGNEDFITEVWLNQDKDLAAGQVVDELLGRTGRYTVENGRVVLDESFAAQAKMREEERVAKDAADAKAEERRALEEYEDQRFAAIQQMNPERAAMMIKNPITGKYDDLSDFVPEKEETNWDEIYQNDARMAATESLMSWARFTDEAQAAEEAARQFPTNPNLPPTDAFNQQALSEQQRAVDVWRTQVNPPEKRAELEREIYNLKLRGQELRKGFKNPPQAADQSEYQQPNGEKKDKPTSFGFLPDVVDNGDTPVVDVDKETDAVLKRVGLSVSSREGQLYALYDALQDTSKTLEENKEQYAYWRSGKGGGFAPGGERRAAFAEKYFNKYAVNGRLPKNIIDEMMAIDKKVQERMNQDRQAQTEVPAESGKKQNRKNYDKAGEYRVGKLPDESIYEQYRSTGRISVASADMDKIPISISVAGKNEYITMVDPNELSSLMKKRNVGPASPVKVRMIPIEDIVDISASENDVERIRNRYGISPFASRKQILAVAADRINNENKKRVHPFKNMFDWSPDLQWFQA